MDLTIYSDGIAAAILKYNLLPLFQVHKAPGWNLLTIQFGSCSNSIVNQPRSEGIEGGKCKAQTGKEDKEATPPIASAVAFFANTPSFNCRSDTAGRTAL